MKYSALLGLLLAGMMCTQLNAQIFGPVCTTDPANNVCIDGTIGGLGDRIDYSRTNAQATWPSFYFFDDGYYSISSNPQHEYYSANSAAMFDPGIYTARAYDPTVPTRLGSIAPVFTNQSSPAPPSLVTKDPVGIKLSWDMTADKKLIYIIPFKHPEVQIPRAPATVQGTITLDLDPRLQNPTILTPSHTPKIWATGGTINGNTVSWNFTDLDTNEVRYLYVEVFVPRSIQLQQVTSNVTMSYDGVAGWTSVYNNRSTQVKKPRDPNSIEVDYDFIPADHPGSQQLRYDVQFFNNGNWYIKDVYVDVTLDYTQLDLSTIRLVNSTAPVTFSLINEETVRFTFDNIYLPGRGQPVCLNPNQTPSGAVPCNQIFSWDDVTANFAFDICTYEMLPPGTITAESEVTFVGVSTLAAEEPAITTVEHGIPPAPGCQYWDMFDGLQMGNSNQAIANTLPTKTEVFPNPFNDQFTISYDLHSLEGATVDIRLLTASGQEVGVIYRGQQDAGAQQYTYDSSQLKAGVYFVQFQDGNTTSTQRIVKIR